MNFSALILIASLALSLSSFAAGKVVEKKTETVTTVETKDNSVLDKTVEVTQETTEQVLKTLNQTRELREKADYFVLGNYSLLDLLIPSKFGITLGYIENADKTWELEYLKGSVALPFILKDLGKMSDQRISIIRRSYFGNNSFNLSYGLSYFDFAIDIGDKLLNRVSGGTFPSMELVGVQSVGFNLALGNRWTFKHNITLGIDWISWAQPVYMTGKKSAFLDYANNQEDKDDVDTALRTISYFPRFSFLKLQLGILF